MFTRTFRKVRANFCLLSCDMGEEPSRNCSDDFFGGSRFCGLDFLLRWSRKRKTQAFWEFPSLVVSNLVVCTFFRGSSLLRSLLFFAPFCALLLRKSSCPQNSCPQFWGRKWLRQSYGRLEFLRSFCRKTLHVHKIPRFRGGGVFWVGGAGSADFIFVGAGIFLICRLAFARCCSHLRVSASDRV